MENQPSGMAMGAFGIVYIAFIALIIVSMWKVFVKAGKPGWAAIIPIYNLIVLLEIVGRPLWWIVGLIIPFVNFIVLVILSLDLAKSFGKSTAFGIGLLFLGFIFYPILAFGDAVYQGPSAQQSNKLVS
ncbi:DUF5684 domain-containing protein [Solitalea canadensis]|uniref:Signal peptidase I n=1 Tax=Solitalea canadensis (strain ATCC 29591 / DSM 3403 / JCM 21819 / LMG 8368 / NBRC 15130 / NCIMB 12057 / USAM 9D) TaxID=929556 RepID=H8KPB0_SOLCM|nr:DUF5684 domain-containing protein [Solitalea canadensis]AFD05808.1 hypothetical protein Solca_0683 [Solitalea canadensis DSM 3403]